MSNTFLISDTHFGHVNIITFKRRDGITPLRPFSSVEEMDETMVQNWNSVVKPTDKIYHVGDVAIHKRCLPILSRLNGEKVLIKGNHDQEKIAVYAQYFKDVRAYHQLDKFILAHIPIHPQSLGRWKAQIHGHLHSDLVLEDDGSPDLRYFNVSVEQINYTPISVEELNKIYNERHVP